MNVIAIHNDYAGLVAQFEAKVILSAAVLRADPESEDPCYEESIHLAEQIWDGLNELDSSLELFVESIPEGSLESVSLRTNQTAVYDATADKVMAWQRQIRKVKARVYEYRNSEIEPQDSTELILLLRHLPQRP
jgi:hypothetical protein